jgi:hypothetical protein
MVSKNKVPAVNPDLVIQFEKMALNLYNSGNCMKIGHDLIQEFRDLGIQELMESYLF